MPWGAAVGAGISLIGQSMQSDKNGGAGTTTNTKEPWAPAIPWITSNLASGQDLENKYLANPQSPQQAQAVQNIYGQSDYMRNLIPSLLGQLQSQPVGYDPKNPQKQQAWQWGGTGGASGGPNLGGGGSMSAANVPVAAPAQSPGDFVDQGAVSWDPWAGNPSLPALQSQYTGKYGDFKYGDQPKPGTKAYADMNAYKNYGGSDPLNIYGWNPPAPAVTYSPAGN